MTKTKKDEMFEKKMKDLFEGIWEGTDKKSDNIILFFMDKKTKNIGEFHSLQSLSIDEGMALVQHLNLMAFQISQSYLDTEFDEMDFVKPPKIKGADDEKKEWRPFCLGEYQGVGDNSCFECPFTIQCQKLAERRKEMETK